MIETSSVAIEINLLKSDWQYNLEIGCRILLAKRVASASEGDDATLLENWWYTLAYYNGFVSGGANDPANPIYSRTVSENWHWLSISRFPYQECVFNIIAQLYTLPIDLAPYFESNAKVTLPGPAAVSGGAGHYNYVDASFSGQKSITYYKDNRAVVSEQTFNNVTVHQVEFEPTSVSWGTYVGKFNGVNAYSNGSVDYLGPYGTYGYQYQCVEYVNRYYVLALGHKNMRGTGNANNYYSTASSKDLEAYPNGGNVPPKPGDILCSNGGTYGHVAIVREVTGNSVHVIQQNWYNDSHDNDITLGMSVSGGRYTISGFSTKYPVVGWLHKLGGGYASVSSGVTVTPSPVCVDDRYEVTFTLKETKGAPITFAEIAVLIRDANNDDLFYLDDHEYNRTIPANGTWTYNGHGWAVGKLSNPGTYKAVARGRVDSNWFDFTTTGSGVNPRTFQVIEKSGYASVSSGVTVTPSPVCVDDRYEVTFTLKETKGAPITFAEIAVLIRDANNNDLFYLDDHEYNRTIPANGTWTYNGHGWAVGKLSTPGTYKAVARGKVNNWFDFATTGNGVNPRVFQVIPKPNADFAGTPTNGCAPLTVQFTDNSTGNPTNWSWNFGDGGTSSQKNPSHTYTSAGTYTVSLNVSNQCGNDTETKTSYITVLPKPDADFAGTPTSGCASLNVQFTDKSTGNPTSWSWDFGDGGTSSQKNPSHTYNSAGTYTVCLTMSNECGEDTECKENYITVLPKPDADFVGTPTSGCASLNVQFNDKSTGTPTSWSWDFGDGGTSSQRNPSHIYTSAGTYTVSLTVSNQCGNDTETKTSYITVSEHTVTITSGPTANPNSVSSGGAVSLSVTATDSQGHSINYSWTVSPDEGSFDNPNKQNPIWTAPENCTGGDKPYTFTATATCSVDANVKDTGTVEVIVKPRPHTVKITSGPTANPTTLPSSAGGPVVLSVDATDSCGHAINYSWTVSPDEGSFDDADKQNPVWTAPANNTSTDKPYTITVTATCSLDSNIKDTGDVTVIVPGGPLAIIKPVADSQQQAGAEFTVDIKVEDVTNLFGIAFVFNYDTTYIDALSAGKGDFLGGDVLFLDPVIDNVQGTVSIGITRKRPAGGVDGSGVVATVKFKSDPATPDGTFVDFTITNINANDPDATPIPFTPEKLTVEFISLCVWPGDTNNDGKVDQADVLPLGLHWNRTGPARQGASSQWECQPAQPWAPEAATFADANGDGFIDQADVLPIGLNWGLTCDASSLAPVFLSKWSKISECENFVFAKPIVIQGPVRNQFTVGIKVEQVRDLFGIAFAFDYAHPNAIKPLSVEAGNFLDNDVIFYHNVDDSEGMIHIGMSRKRPQGGVDGSGIVAKITFQSDLNLPAVRMTIREITATDSDGRAIPFRIVLDSWKDGEWILPLPQTPVVSKLAQNFPNPFNPETWIPFQLMEPADVTISIYDASGKVIRDIDLDEKPAGFYTSKETAAYWDGRNANGEEVASGVYFYAIRASKFAAIKKMIIVR